MDDNSGRQSQLKDFICKNCGGTVKPPMVAPPVTAKGLNIEYFVVVSFPCQNKECGKIHKTILRKAIKLETKIKILKKL